MAEIQRRSSGEPTKAGFEALRLRVDAIAMQLDNLSKRVDNVDIVELRDVVKRLQTLIDGDERYGVTGLREEIEEIQKLTRVLADERQRIKWIMIGVGLTGVTNLGTIIAIISRILGSGL